MTADKNTDFDVYSVIRSAEIRDYFRREDCLDFFEKEQLILHSYTSVQQKMDMLRRLAQTGKPKDRRRVTEMCQIYKRYTDLVYHPTERTVLLLEQVEPVWENGNIYEDRGFIAAFDTLDEVTEELEQICGGIEKEYYGLVTVLQVPQDAKVKHVFRFTLIRLEGSWQIKNLMIETEELRGRGFSKSTIFRFKSWLEHHPLPFKDGERLKIQLPFMEEPVYGILGNDKDGNGCWYHWLDDWKINLTYWDFDLCSGYSTLDWLERA